MWGRPMGSSIAVSYTHLDVYKRQLYQNPDAADAAATSARVTAGGACAVTGGCVIRNSGVINYLNKFGQMNTGKNVKSQDNVSELYYTAIRYFKHFGDVPAYSVLSGNATNSCLLYTSRCV